MRPRWTAIIWRVAADVVAVGISLAGGFSIRLALAVFQASSAAPQPLLVRLILEVFAPTFRPPQQLLPALAAYYTRQGPLLAAALVGAYALSGVYTRTRFYTRRYKALALFQAISLAYAAFLFLVYISGPSQGFIPRGAFLMAYLLTLALSMGSRLVKGYLERGWTLDPSGATATRPIRKVLVVGGAGYIGSGMVRDLLSDGYQVRVLDALQYGIRPIENLLQNPDFQLVEGDFRRVEPVVEAVRGMDAVIHLGAIVGDPACAVDEDATLETNLAATRLLADVCRASGVSRVLFASTCSVYGAADHLVNERSESKPVSLYAATKIDSERVLLAARSRSFHPVILRLATAFGWSHRPRFDLVLNLLVAKAAFEKKILIYNGEQWRPFIHVSDISRAFRAALAAPLDVVGGEIFNAGSNHMNFTLHELAEQISAVEPGLEIEYVRNSDARNYRVQFDKIRAALGFECRVSLDVGIREIRQAIREGRVTDYRDARYSNLKWMAERRSETCKSHAALSLTALHFAPNSRWSRALAAGDSAAALLDGPSASLAALAQAVQAGRQPGSGSQERRSQEPGVESAVGEFHGA